MNSEEGTGQEWKNIQGSYTLSSRLTLDATAEKSGFSENWVCSSRPEENPITSLISELQINRFQTYETLNSFGLISVTLQHNRITAFYSFHDKQFFPNFFFPKPFWQRSKWAAEQLSTLLIVFCLANKRHSSEPLTRQVWDFHPASDEVWAAVTRQRGLQTGSCWRPESISAGGTDPSLRQRMCSGGPGRSEWGGDIRRPNYTTVSPQHHNSSGNCAHSPAV